MLQQTTVEAVVPYYRRWVKTYPDIGTLDRAPLSRILKDWQGLGYYERARNVKAAARLIVARHRGRLPDSLEELTQLPGIGPYTAAAILSLARDRSLPVLEANVRRVMMRLLGLRGPFNGRAERTIRQALALLLPRRNAGSFNQAMMELGALVCRPASPLCASCPIAVQCGAHRRGEQDRIPPRKARPTQQVTAAVAVISRDGKVLIQKRPDKGLLAGLWEFPGGKVEPGETIEGALRREIREELGVDVLDLVFLMRVKHAYTKYRVDLHAFFCRTASPPRLSTRRLWVRPSALRNYAFPAGSAKIVAQLPGIEDSVRRRADGR